VTFDQFVKWQLDRKAIAPAIRELVALGFVEVTEKGCAGNENQRRAHRFRPT
jgi:competence protein ComGC